MVNPIRPCDVVSYDAVSQKPEIPVFIVKVMNDLILRKWNGISAVIFKDDVVKEIEKRMPVTVIPDIFNMHWMNIKDFYKEAGWNVYDECHVCCVRDGACYRFHKPSPTALNS